MPIGHGVGRFNGGDDALRPGQILKGTHRLLIGDRDIFRPADGVEMGVFRTNARVVQPG